MRRLLGWPAAFARFWYRFIVGDDWIMAATVAVALAITALLNRRGASVWWLVPLVVVSMVTVRLRRTRRS